MLLAQACLIMGGSTRKKSNLFKLQSKLLRSERMVVWREMFLLSAGFCDGLLMAWDPGLQPFLPAPGCKSARVQNITGDRPLLHSTVSGKLYHAPNCIMRPTASNCTTIIDPRTNCNGLHHEKLHGPGVCREVGVNDCPTVIHFHPLRRAAAAAGRDAARSGIGVIQPPPLSGRRHPLSLMQSLTDGTAIRSDETKPVRGEKVAMGKTSERRMGTSRRRRSMGVLSASN